MKDIIKDQLWVGTARDARDPVRWLEAGVQAIVDLAIDETPGSPTHEVIYFRIPLMDGTGNSPATLRTAVDATTYLIRHDIPTLVCCSSGMSRSPAVVAAALSLVRCHTPDECLTELVVDHSLDVSPGLWHELKLSLHGE